MIAARVKATEAVSSALTWKRKHEANSQKKVAKWKKQGKEIKLFRPVKAPHSASCPICYDTSSYRLNWQTSTAKLSTCGKQIKIPFSASQYAQQFFGEKTASADLCYRKGRFWLYVVVSIPPPQVETDSTVIGVDLGETRPAVTSWASVAGKRKPKAQKAPNAT